MCRQNRSVKYPSIICKIFVGIPVRVGVGGTPMESNDMGIGEGIQGKQRYGGTGNDT